MLIAASGHTLAGREGAAFADLLDEPFVGLSDGALHDHLASRAQRLGWRITYRLRLRSFDAVARRSGRHIQPQDSRYDRGTAGGQVTVFVALKYGEKRAQKDLAALAEVEQSSMAQLLNRMERDGLICREAAPDDKCSSLISLTIHTLTLLEPGRDVSHQIHVHLCA